MIRDFVPKSEDIGQPRERRESEASRKDRYRELSVRRSTLHSTTIKSEDWAKEEESVKRAESLKKEESVKKEESDMDDDISAKICRQRFNSQQGAMFFLIYFSMYQNVSIFTYSLYCMIE